MIKLIAALGNPGQEYALTRHNAGWLGLEAWTQTQAVAPWKEDKKFSALRSEAAQGDKRAWLLRPLTFMNLSGRAVVPFLQFYKIAPEELLVIHDEAAFDLGVLRLSFGGSSGGHNGVESIIAGLGHERFWRLRLGIGPKTTEIPLSDWVLEKLSEEGQMWLKSEKIAEALSLIVDKGPELAQNCLNQRI